MVAGLSAVAGVTSPTSSQMRVLYVSPALRLALRAIGTRPGDRVLVPAYACVALPNAVAALGAEPVAVDVEPDTWTIDPGRGGAAAGPAAAVLAVHTFGAPAAVAALQVAGARVVDDAAHGLPAGVAHAGATVTSFYATKLVGGAEGGAVLADDAAIAAFAGASATTPTARCPASGSTTR